MKQLRELGIFDSVDFYNFDWFRNVPMRAEYYNFEHGVWEFDWDKPVEHEQGTTMDGFEPFSVDKVDLLIMKELQADSTRSLSDIREAIKANDGIDINYKTLAWHWIRHVQEKRMINGYMLRWMGTRYDPTSEKAQHRQHRYVVVPILVHGVSDAERLNLMSEMNKVPFIWSEAAGERLLRPVRVPGRDGERRLHIPEGGHLRLRGQGCLSHGGPDELRRLHHILSALRRWGEKVEIRRARDTDEVPEPDRENRGRFRVDPELRLIIARRRQKAVLAG